MNPGAGSARQSWRMTPARWLLVAIAVYFAVSFALSWLRAVELQTTTWDQGVYQQALWTTAHGRPFYETADVETGGYGSFLEVHSAFVLYLVVPLYGALPYQTTLFAVQSSVIALAAIPLYWLACDVTRSPRAALVAGIAYLCWTPTLSSNLYDFHAEAFIPIEIFSLVLLWNRERYTAGFAVALLAYLTFEFTPLIAFFVGVFALLPASASLPGWKARLRAAASAPWESLQRCLRPLRVRASLALMGASAIAYVALFALRVDVLPSIVASTPLPSAATGYVIGATPAALGLSMGNLAIGFGTKLSYWLLILGLLAFVPVLAPRALVLTAPWFTFTLFSSNLNYVTLGFQYGEVAGSTVLIAFVFGLPRAQRALESWTSAHGPAEHPEPRTADRPARTRIARTSVGVGIAVLLAVNVALTPVNPAMQNAGLGSAYRVSYDPPAGASDIQSLAGLIPSGATVLASDDLFPLVANDAQAYSFLWEPDSSLYLPFTFADPPTYVFIAENRAPAVISWLAAALYDPSEYGVRGVVWASPVGTVLLFEVHYDGAPVEFGPPPASEGEYFGSPLASGPVGVPAVASGSTFPTVVESVSGAIGTVWYGPDITLAAGNYTISLSLRVAPLEGFPVPNGSAAVVWVGAFAFAQPSFYGETFSFGSLNGTSFSIVDFRVSLPSPTIDFDIQGQLLDSSVQVTLNYLEVAPE